MNSSINEKKLQTFMEKIMSDIGTTWTAVLVYLGYKLGLYEAMYNSNEAISAERLSRLTGTSERYVREWLANQSAAGYIEYDASSDKYELPIEHAIALVNGRLPGLALGGFQIAMSLFKDEQKIRTDFQNGKGIDWGMRNENLFVGLEQYFRSIYSSNLIRSWIPSVQGAEEKLNAGCKVADIGCGPGIATVIMAKAYPNSTFVGFDYHKVSIERARKIAEDEGLDKQRISFNVASSTDFSGKEYDLVTFFACLHDMGDPIAAATRAFNSLTSDGILMVIEPFAYDNLEDNLNPVGRLFYAASTLICIPTSLSQNGPALGAQAGKKRIEEIIRAAGFSQFRTAITTPYNAVYEARR